MRIQVQMVIIADDGTQQEQLITTLQREAPRAETLGLTLAESKEILQQTQQVLIGHQIAAYLANQRPCPACVTPRRIKQQAPPRFARSLGGSRSRTHAGITVAVSRSRPKPCAPLPSCFLSGRVPNCAILN